MYERPNSDRYRFTVGQLLSHALTIELEAAQSYAELADVMKQSRNADVAKVFEKMSVIETKHARSINEQAGFLQLPLLSLWQFHWVGFEPPENIERAKLSPDMTSRRALELALDAERCAYDFFSTVLDNSTDKQVREFAADFAAEEEEHVFWIKEWLAKS